MEVWCRASNLCINVKKIKEMIVDFRKSGNIPPPLHIGGVAVEVVSSFKYLGVHINNELTWTNNVASLIKKAHQRLYFLKKLKYFSPHNHFSPQPSTDVWWRVFLPSVWWRNCYIVERSTLEWVVKSAKKIIKHSLPSVSDIYITRCRRRAACILRDLSHLENSLFATLHSGRMLLSIRGQEPPG